MKAALLYAFVDEMNAQPVNGGMKMGSG